ncbi:MAG: hypothetical protein HY887_03755 [Deltaproteobacteria bacterium]|nr:hypothetical protein [Deltaproteobacteria bacterium]
MPAVKEKTLYGHFAGLLKYPKEDIKLRVEECIKALALCPQYPPEAAGDMQRFRKYLDEQTLDDIQGIYSYTFEMTSEFTMDLGTFIYEGYKRTHNLVALKTMYRERGFPYDEVAKGEMPDYLPVILEFLEFVKDDELKLSLLQDFVIKAVEKLNKSFERNRENIYGSLISAVYRVLDKDVKFKKEAK